MRLEVRLFGGIAARAGTPRIMVDLPDEATAATLRETVAADYPALGGLLGSAKVAVNLEVADADERLRPGDEVALLPPVAGGSGVRETTILTGLRRPPLDVAATVSAIGSSRTGATAVFLGTVRDHADGMDEVVRLEYSAYEEMADATLRTIAEEVAARWPPIEGIAILHAVGDLDVGTETILVACSAPHRLEAFEACRHALEEVKRRVPVWKREVGPAGERWVGADPC